MAMKKNFQKPQARVYDVVEESALLTPSINIAGGSDEKVEDSEDIGFSRDGKPQSPVWDN